MRVGYTSRQEVIFQPVWVDRKTTNHSMASWRMLYSAYHREDPQHSFKSKALQSLVTRLAALVLHWDIISLHHCHIELNPELGAITLHPIRDDRIFILNVIFLWIWFGLERKGDKTRPEVKRSWVSGPSLLVPCRPSQKPRLPAPPGCPRSLAGPRLSGGSHNASPSSSPGPDERYASEGTPCPSPHLALSSLVYKDLLSLQLYSGQQPTETKPTPLVSHIQRLPKIVRTGRTKHQVPLWVETQCERSLTRLHTSLSLKPLRRDAGSDCANHILHRKKEKKKSMQGKRFWGVGLCPVYLLCIERYISASLREISSTVVLCTVKYNK